MIHISHPDIRDGGLADGCPRCLEQAEKPIATLDDGNLGALVRLAIDRDRLAKGRSEAELVAAANVLTTLERAGRLFEVAPLEVGRYLAEKWGVRLEHIGRLVDTAERRVDA